MRILRESFNAFAIEGRFNELPFELSLGIFLLFHIHMELFFRYFFETFYTFDSITPFDSDLTQIGTGCLLQNLLLLFLQLSHSRCILPFPVLF